MLPQVKIKRKEKIENRKISNLTQSNLITKYLIVKRKENPEISEIYHKAVGDVISSVSSVVKYEKGVLTLKIKNAVWKNELKFKEEEMKKLINSQKNRNLQINKIIFK